MIQGFKNLQEGKFKEEKKKEKRMTAPDRNFKVSLGR